MAYLCMGLIIIVLALSAYLFFLHLALVNTVKQMEDIELNPERNRQLKAITANPWLEKLLRSINRIYQARQKERIVYQRSENRIRREIENISHDLRTPLTSILGYLDLIEDGATEEEKQEYLSIIRKRARVLQGFIQDFYEISRIEGENYPIQMERIIVQGMLKDAAVAYYHEFEKKRLDVTIELEENPVAILVDKIQFNRILNNLLQNTLKYAEKKFVLKQFQEAGCLVIQFRNDKTRISEEELGHIFERFYTGDQSRTNLSTGLGLTITKLLVDQMKGAIEARFEEDMFVIELRWSLMAE